MLRDTVTYARKKASDIEVEYVYSNIGNDGTNDNVEEVLEDIDTQLGVTLDHLDGSDSKHDATEIDVEYTYPNIGNDSTSIDTLEEVLGDIDTQLGVTLDHLDGGYNKHDASEVDVEYTYANIGNDGTADTVEEVLGDIDTQLGTALDHLDGISETKHTADQIEIENISGSTYINIQDYLNISTSASLVSGGIIYDSTGDMVNVCEGTGFIKIVESEITTTKIFDFPCSEDTVLTANTLNHIYIDYNSGNPQVLITLDESDINNYTQFELGHVYLDGVVKHIVPHGPRITNFLEYLNHRLHAEGHIITGLVTTEVGTRNIRISSGSMWTELVEKLITEKNTSISDTFIYHYRSGGSWTESYENTQIDNTQYDNGTNLVELTANRYGVHWVFMHEDGDISIVYGQGDYTLTQAENAGVPGSLPGVVSTISSLIARIIIQKNAGIFADISYPFEETFLAGSVGDHNDFGNIQGGTVDEYYHLTNTEYTSLETYDDHLDGSSSKHDATEIDVENTYTYIGNDGTSDTVEEVLGDIDTQLGIIEGDAHSQNTDTKLDNGEIEIDADDCLKIKETAYFDAEFDNGNSGTEKTISWKVGNKQKITLTGNCTFTFTAPSGACNLLLKLIQDDTGSRTVTWPGTVKWPSGIAPTLSTGIDDIDIVSIYFDGSDYYCVASFNFS